VIIVRGPESAPITLVEYGDHECPHCALAIRSSTGCNCISAAHAVRVPPLPHDRSSSARRDRRRKRAEFAGAAGLFWDMHDAVFTNQSRLSLPTIFRIAEQLGLTETALRKALKTGQYRNKVRSDFMGGIRSGVNGTPTFFINGVRHDGVMPPWWQESRCASPPTRAHSGSAGGIGAICDSKTSAN
jgi:protein-disulfide isomerase